jgi:hypothetical protein
MPKAKHAHRTMRTITLSPRSEAILARMSERTGIARGRLVDAALDLIEVCPDCHGAGVVSGPYGQATETCPGCAGHRVRPAQ